tara:strand:- start:533 stop:712 length:180 start_codon:yes stop_codon:yes gene_type:complete
MEKLKAILFIVAIFIVLTVTLPITIPAGAAIVTAILLFLATPPGMIVALIFILWLIFKK